MKNLPQIAKDRRKELRLSQKELAKRLGIRQASISDMENNKHDSRLLALDIIEHLGGHLKVEWKKDVYATYLFPNNMVVTFDFNDNQIPELQGKYSEKLKEAIKTRCSDRTKNKWF